MSEWAIIAIIYVVCFIIVAVAFQGIDWGKIVKPDKKGLAIVIYIIVSIAVAAMVAAFFVALTPLGSSV